jgi:hypothetical protein
VQQRKPFCNSSLIITIVYLGFSQVLDCILLLLDLVVLEEGLWEARLGAPASKVG